MKGLQIKAFNICFKRGKVQKTRCYWKEKVARRKYN